MWNAQKERRERAKGTAKSEDGFLIETAAKVASEESAPRPNVASAHKMNMRLNIDYTHKNNVRTEIYYIHTDNNVRTQIYLHSTHNI